MRGMPAGTFSISEGDWALRLFSASGGPLFIGADMAGNEFIGLLFEKIHEFPFS